jgi:hypothetical protein
MVMPEAKEQLGSVALATGRESARGQTEHEQHGAQVKEQTENWKTRKTRPQFPTPPTTPHCSR